MTSPECFQGRRILVVEDDYHLADALALALATYGVEVLGPVPTVQAALDVVAHAERIDGAIIDVNLRGDVAYPVADELRRKGVRFVFTTGYDASSVAREARDVPCFEKPVSPERLLEALVG